MGCGASGNACEEDDGRAHDRWLPGRTGIVTLTADRVCHPLAGIRAGDRAPAREVYLRFSLRGRAAGASPFSSRLRSIHAFFS